MPNKRVLIFDTTILCCLLKVPGKETAGPDNDRWDSNRVSDLVKHEEGLQSTFVLPLATLIETGNHIAQAPQLRHECATELGKYLVAAAAGKSPWAAFTEQTGLWEADNLRKLAARWPDLAAAKHAIGDATIVDVAEYYASADFEVQILTADQGLKSYQPSGPRTIPRRRR